MNLDFYKEWQDCHETEGEKHYIDSFLNYSPQSLEALLHGDKESIKTAMTVLLSVPISKFVAEINSANNFIARDIIQYSNFDHAISSVCACCEFEKQGLSFAELGKRIMSSKLEGACTKYGENHAKFAEILSFVKITNNKPLLVTNTSLGTFSLSLTKNEKFELVKRLALRNPFIKTLIYRAKEGIIQYFELAEEVLSASTCIRRRTNVKFVTTLILLDEPEKNNIIW